MTSDGHHHVMPLAERTMPARFASTCPSCGNNIKKGEEIGLYKKQFLCSSCVEIPPSEPEEESPWGKPEWGG